MPRYILIDHGSGYVWGDSADFGGRIFTGTPVEYAAALDASLGEHNRTYEEVPRQALGANETGYHVYRADVRGSDAIGHIHDGQDAETIAAVERDCEYVTSLRVVEAEEEF